LDEEGKERKKQLELRKSQIEDEIQNDTQGLKTSLQQQLEQIDEELSEFDDYYDVYDITPKNEEFYSNMEIFETSWDNSQYAIGNERELKWSAEEYAKQIIESEGINFFSKSFLENYIDDDSVQRYAEDMYNDLIYQDPESWLDESQRETSYVQDNEIKYLNYQIEKVKGEIVNLQQLMEKSPRELRGVFENKISQLEDNAIYEFEQKIEEIEESPEGDFPDDLINQIIEERVNDVMDDSLSFIREWDLELSNFINEDELIEGWIDSDGYEIMSHYDGKVDEQKVEGVLYFIIRVE
jgi:peptidoglycan hydrolase CwlO-like protein